MTSKSYASLLSALRSAFERRVEQIGFGMSDKEFLFVAEYTEWPFVKGMLFIPAGEPDMWAVIDANGECACDEHRPPEPWRGLPSFVAEKIAAAASLNCHDEA
jgi:hypothetical protein